MGNPESIKIEKADIQSLSGPDKLKQYKQEFLNTANKSQGELSQADRMLKTSEAKSFLMGSANDINGYLRQVATKGRAIQAKHDNKEELAASEYQPLDGLKTSLQSELSELHGETPVFRILEKGQADFDREKKADDAINSSSSLARLQGNLALKAQRLRLLEAARGPVESCNPKSSGGLYLQTTVGGQFSGLIGDIKRDIERGNKILEIKGGIKSESKDLSILEKDLASKKVLTWEEYESYKQQLDGKNASIIGQYSTLKETIDGSFSAPFVDNLASECYSKLYKPVSERFGFLYSLLEMKKLAIAGQRESADDPHQLIMQVQRARGEFQIQSEDSQKLLKQLAKIEKNQKVYLNPVNFEETANQIENLVAAIDETKSRSGIEAKMTSENVNVSNVAKEVHENYYLPTRARALELKKRHDQREKPMKEFKEKAFNEHLASLLPQMQESWKTNVDDRQQFLKTPENLDEKSQEYKQYIDGEKAMFLYLVACESQVSPVLNMVDSGISAENKEQFQQFQQKIQDHQKKIVANRAYRKIRQVAKEDQELMHEEKVLIRTIEGGVKMVGGKAVVTEAQQVNRTERSGPFKFNEFIRFIDPNDPNFAKINGGKGWDWIKTEMPDDVRERFILRADKIASESKDVAEKEAFREKQEIIASKGIYNESKEKLGADAKDYFAASDALAKGDTAGALSGFNAYVKLSKSFKPAVLADHQQFIDDANRQIEIINVSANFYAGMNLLQQGKVNEALPLLRSYIILINARAPEDRIKFADQLNAAKEVLNDINSTKMKMMVELKNDLTFLSAMEMANGMGTRRINIVGELKKLEANSHAIANGQTPPYKPGDIDLDGERRTLLLPYLPYDQLTDAEKQIVGTDRCGVRGPDMQRLNGAIENLQQRISNGEPVDFEMEVEAIKQRIAEEMKKKSRRETLDRTSEQLFSLFAQINSTKPDEREKGFVAIADRFKEAQVGMVYTQKWLNKAMAYRYDEFEQVDGGATKKEVTSKMLADKKVAADVLRAAKELYKRQATEHNRDLKPGEQAISVDPPDASILQRLQTQIFNQQFQSMYEREMRHKMSQKGEESLKRAEAAFNANRDVRAARGGQPSWADLPVEQKIARVDGTDNKMLARQLLSGALGRYNTSLPYDVTESSWYKPWSWSDCSEDNWNVIKDDLADFAVETVVTLPIGMGAGAIGRSMTSVAIKALVKQGVKAEAIKLIEQGGIMALRSNSAAWREVPTAVKQAILAQRGRVVAAWTGGLAVEGTSMMLMNSIWEGLSTGKKPEIFRHLDEKEWIKASGSLLEAIAKAGVYRSFGAIQGRFTNVAGGASAGLARRAAVNAVGETASGFAGTGLEALAMMAKGHGDQITTDFWVRSIVQNALQSAGTHIAHRPSSEHEQGSARERSLYDKVETEVSVSRLRDAGVGKPTDISDVFVANDGQLRINGRVIDTAMIPIESLPKQYRERITEQTKATQDAATNRITNGEMPIEAIVSTDNGRLVLENGQTVVIPNDQIPESHRPHITELRRAEATTKLRDGTMPLENIVAVRDGYIVLTDGTRMIREGTEIDPLIERFVDFVEKQEVGRQYAHAEELMTILGKREAALKNPEANEAILKNLDAQLAKEAENRGISVDDLLARIPAEHNLYRSSNDLYRHRDNLYQSSKVVTKANGERVDLFTNMESKRSAYSVDLLEGMDHASLMENGARLQKIGGDELILYHPGANGEVQILNLDISNMGPANDVAINLDNSKVNLVDVYLFKVSEKIKSLAEQRKGQNIDKSMFDGQVADVVNELFYIDRDPATGRPYPENEANARYSKLASEWGLSGDYQDYVKSVRAMRYMAEYRADTRDLNSSYKAGEGKSFSEHIVGRVEEIAGMNLVEVQALFKKNESEVTRLISESLPEAKPYKPVDAARLLEVIANLNNGSKAQDIMPLYNLLARLDFSSSKNADLHALGETLSQTRTGKVGDPPHPRVLPARIMDAKAVQIMLAPDLVAAMQKVGESDPAQAHAILAAARSLSENALNKQKYARTETFAEFNMADHVAVRDGEIVILSDQFRNEVAVFSQDKKVPHIASMERTLNETTARVERIRRDYSDRKITAEQMDDMMRIEYEQYSKVYEGFMKDPDTMAYSQDFLDQHISEMFITPDGTVPIERQIMHSMTADVSHLGAINTQYRTQGADRIMTTIYDTLVQGLADEGINNFKVFRSGGGKLEVIVLDSAVVDGLLEKGKTVRSVVEGIISSTAQPKVDAILNENREARAKADTDVAVRNSGFEYVKGGQTADLGKIFVRREIGPITHAEMAAARQRMPKASTRAIIGEVVRSKMAARDAVVAAAARRGIDLPQGSIDNIHPVYSRNDSSRPISEVPRSRRTNAIGDLHGNGEIFVANLVSAGLIAPGGDFRKPESLRWIGGDGTVIFHGDIMADRGADSLLIMEGLRHLQAQAKETGGEVVIISGNHEDTVLSFLGGTQMSGDCSPLNFAIFGDQGKGLIELIRKYSSDQNLRSSRNLLEIAKNAGFNIVGDPDGKYVDPKDKNFPAFEKQMAADILKNMRNDDEGRILLEQMTTLRLAEYIDDSLFLHTDPTPDMVNLLAKYGKTVGEAVDNINLIYQQGLRFQLLGEGSMPDGFNDIKEAFLNTSNRTGENDYAGVDLSGLHERGVNRVIHGHSTAKKPLSRNGIIITSVDYGAGKEGTGMYLRSVGVIDRSGDFFGGRGEVEASTQLNTIDAAVVPKAALTHRVIDDLPLEMDVSHESVGASHPDDDMRGLLDVASETKGESRDSTTSSMTTLVRSASFAEFVNLMKMGIFEPGQMSRDPAVLNEALEYAIAHDPEIFGNNVQEITRVLDAFYSSRECKNLVRKMQPHLITELSDGRGAIYQVGTKAVNIDQSAHQILSQVHGEMVGTGIAMYMKGIRDGVTKADIEIVHHLGEETGSLSWFLNEIADLPSSQRKELLSVISELDAMKIFHRVEGEMGDLGLLFYNMAKLPTTRRKEILIAISELATTNLGELNFIKRRVIDDLLDREQPLERWKRIKQKITSNLPDAAKMLMYFDVAFGRSLDGRMAYRNTSPMFKEARSRRDKQYTVLMDILKTQIDSNNHSLRDFVTTIKKGEALTETVTSRDEDGFRTDQEAGQVFEYIFMLRESLQESLLFRSLPDAQRNSIFSSPEINVNNYREIYAGIKTALKLKPGQSVADRVVEMYFKPLGYESSNHLLERMDTASSAADERGRHYAESGLNFTRGDLIKGAKADQLEGILSRGIVASEFVPEAAAGVGMTLSAETNETPLGPDFYRIDSENTIGDYMTPEAIKSVGAYGDIAIIVKNRGQFYGRQDVVGGNRAALRRDPRYEIVETNVIGENHVDVRTGLGSSEIDGIVILQPMEQAKVDVMFKKIAENGVYIPIYDAQGALMFSPEQFDSMRNLNGTVNDRHHGETVRPESLVMPFENSSKVIAAENANVNAVFLDQMGYAGEIGVGSFDYLKAQDQTNFRGIEIEKINETYRLTSRLYSGKLNKSRRNISSFEVHLALPMDASGRDCQKILQLAHEFVAQRRDLRGVINFQMDVPERGKTRPEKILFDFTDQESAKVFAEYMDQQLTQLDYPVLSDPLLGRVGNGRALIGVETTDISGQRITHQERVKSAQEESNRVCHGEAACNAKVFKKWRLDADTKQPLLGPEAISTSEIESDLPPPTPDEILPSNMIFNDNVLGTYQGAINLIPRKTITSENADPDFLNIMGNAVERSAARLINGQFASCSNLMDSLAFERQRANQESLMRTEGVGVRRPGTAWSPITENYGPFRMDAERLVNEYGVNPQEVNDPTLKTAIDQSMASARADKVYVTTETIPTTGERVALTIIAKDPYGALIWVHPTPENYRKVMVYVETLFQRTQNPEISRIELIDTVAEIQWWVSHAMPYERGSAAISDALSKTLLLQHGIRPGRWQIGIMPDIQAFHTPLKHFIRDYSTYFESKPEGMPGQDRTHIETETNLSQRTLEDAYTAVDTERVSINPDERVADFENEPTRASMPGEVIYGSDVVTSGRGVEYGTESPDTVRSPIFESLSNSERSQAVESLNQKLVENPDLAERINNIIQKRHFPPDLLQNLETMEIKMLTESDISFLNNRILEKILRKQYNTVSEIIDGKNLTIRYYTDPARPLGKGGFAAVKEGYFLVWETDGTANPHPILRRAAIREPRKKPQSSIGNHPSIQYEIDTANAIRENKRNLPTDGLLHTFYRGTRPVFDTSGNVVRTDTVLITELIEKYPGADSTDLNAMLAVAPPEHTLAALSQAVEGLDALHEMGRMHLDVKLQNFVGGLVDGRVEGRTGDLAGMPFMEMRNVELSPAITPKGKRYYQAFYKESGRGVLATPSYLMRAAKHLKCQEAWLEDHTGVTAAPKHIIELADQGELALGLERMSDYYQKHPDKLPPTVASQVIRGLRHIIDKIDDVPDIQALNKNIEKAKKSGNPAEVERAWAARDAAVDSLDNHITTVEIQSLLLELEDLITTARIPSSAGTMSTTDAVAPSRAAIVPPAPN